MNNDKTPGGDLSISSIKVPNVISALDTNQEHPSALTFEELQQNLCQQMISAFSVDACLIGRIQQSEFIVVHHYTKRQAGDAQQDNSYHQLASTPLSAWPLLQNAVSSREPAVMYQNNIDTHPQEVDLLQQLNYTTLAAIPLVDREHVTGLMLLFAVPQQTFTKNELQLAQLLANQANIAIENARLYSMATQQLQRRVDELAALERIGEELNSTLDLSKILGLVLEEALRVTQADYGNVYFYNAVTQTLVGYQEQNWPQLTALQNDDQTTSAKLGVVGRALHTGQSVHIPDVSKDKDFVDLGRNTRSEVVVPIYYGGEPVAVINLESRQLNFFMPGQLRYLEALANHAAIAIGNAQAYLQQKFEREQASRRADQLARLSEISNAFRTNRSLHDVLEDIAYAIAETVGYDIVMISLVQGNPPMLHHQVGAGIPISQFELLQQPEQANILAGLREIMGQASRLGLAYFIPVEQRAIWQDKLNVPLVEKNHALAHQSQQSVDTYLFSRTVKEKDYWQTGDLLFVPLFDTSAAIVGLLTVENPANGERPDAAVVQTLETFANHAAAAIENARLFELETQRRQLADTLRGVAEAISAQLDLDELLNVVLQALSRVVNYDSANFQLLREDELVIIGGRGWEDSQKVIGLSFSMSGDNPNRIVLETQEPLIVNDAQQEYPDTFPPPLHLIRSWLGVPLTYGTHVLGLMALDKQQPGFFTEEDGEVVLAFANQVAVALQNTRLFDEAKTQVRQLAALTEVAQSLNRALELKDILNQVLDAVSNLVNERNGSIWFIDKDTNTVKIANTDNISDFLVELFNESGVSVASEPFASVIESGQMLTIAGSRQEDRIARYGLPFPDDVTYVPLKTEAGVIGILAIETIITDKNLRESVTTLADLAAVAIENARLLADTRRLATEMQHLYNLGVAVSGVLDVRQVMRAVVRSALSLSDSEVGAILFWDDESSQYLIEGAAVTEDLATQFGLAQAQWLETKFSRRNPLSLWSEFIHKIIETNQPIVANLTDTKDKRSHLGRGERIAKRLGIRAILGVPIPVQNQINGAIFVSSLAPRGFDRNDIQSLSLVANQASVAVRNAQLVRRLNLMTEELEERVALRTEELAQTLQDLTEERDRVEVLYEIGRELSTSFDLDRVLTEALHLINRAIGISLGSILLLEPGSDKLVYRAALGRDKPLPRGGLETPYTVGYGLAGKVMEDREARIVPDLADDSDWIPRSESGERRSAVVVPLITGDDVVGALLLFHPEPNYFSEAQLRLVTAAGAQIAIAVNNAELYGLIRDQAERLGVTYRQQAAEAAKNEAILKGITDGVLVLDVDYNLVLVNPKAAEILNINTAEIENQPLQQILGRSGSPAELELTKKLYDGLLISLAEIERGAHSSHFRIEVQPKAVAISLAPITFGAEGVPSTVAVLRDISREAEVERLKNEFISTVSHELRTPMTSIKGYADLLLTKQAQLGQLNSQQSRFISIIQSNADRLTDLVNDILEISRIETGRINLSLSSLNIIDTLKEVALSFEAQMAEKDMNFSLSLLDYLPPIYSDKARLMQILVNLIGNAWQYTPIGGNINVYAKVVENFVQIDVEDSGIGIVEQDLDYIFDRFFRSERTEVQVVDGTGLGLSITRAFVEMLGGKIWVKSVLDGVQRSVLQYHLTAARKDRLPLTNSIYQLSLKCY